VACVNISGEKRDMVLCASLRAFSVDRIGFTHFSVKTDKGFDEDRRLICVQGLEINANHWPCLDRVITVLYALNNYEGNAKNNLVDSRVYYIILTSSTVAVFLFSAQLVELFK